MPPGKEYPGTPVDPVKLRAREAVVLNRALHADPLRRWPSCQAFVAALRAAAGCPRPGPAGKEEALPCPPPTPCGSAPAGR